MKISKRNFLKGAACIAATNIIPTFGTIAVADDGYLEITAEAVSKKFTPDAHSSTLWTYNRMSPGPEIRVKKGERVKVRFINKLEEPTSIHWHGIRIENAMDGVSGLTQEAVPTGGVFEYDFIVPDAGTFWYHAHNKSWNQVARGLYGALIVEDELPTFDEDHDITMVVDDWRLDQKNVLETASIGSLMEWVHGGRLGNYLTVNSLSHPVIPLKVGEAYRIRFINCCNARVLGIDPNRLDAKVIAYDGQSLPRPTKLTYEPLLIGPSQRVDFLVQPEKQGEMMVEEVSGNRPFEFATFDVVKGVSKKVSVPKLVANKLPEPDLENANKFDLVMTGGAMGDLGKATYNGRVLQDGEYRILKQAWAFNGVMNLPEEAFFSAKQGETIQIAITNKTAFLHAMHVHGHHFRIIDRSDSDVDEGNPWRDTFLIGPDQTTKIAFVADNIGKWLLHCHMLEHAAAGMNTWFEVV